MTAIDELLAKARSEGAAEALGKLREELEAWLNEDPEMRFATVLVGENLRWCVKLEQLSFEEPHEIVVAKAEAVTLEFAIHLATQAAKLREAHDA